MDRVETNAGEDQNPLPNTNFSNEKGLQGVVDTLPNLIKQCVDLMDTPIEKKMALYATTIMTGALMPEVHFEYYNIINYPNLYAIIIFPPASGKGRLALLPIALKKVVDEQRETNASFFEKYKIEYRRYEKLAFKGEPCEPPNKPKLPLLLIPGNTTSSKLIEQLAENDPDSMSLIYETETDALTYMMHSKFGGQNSMILRNGFHNEPITQMRKLNSEHLVANTPKISLVITGTESQLPNLFRSTEDGTYSRFLVLKGNASTVWKDVSPCEDCKPINDHIEKLADVFYAVYHAFKSRKIKITFTDDQWRAINGFGEPRLAETITNQGDYATSIPKRHSLMIAKIAAIFTGARYFENQIDCTEVECNDDDFKNALWLVEQSYEASISLFEDLSKKKEKNESKMEEFFDMVPDSFLKRELAPLKSELGISERTLERSLETLIKAGKLISPKKGQYKKVKVADVSDGGSNN